MLFQNAYILFTITCDSTYTPYKNTSMIRTTETPVFLQPPFLPSLFTLMDFIWEKEQYYVQPNTYESGHSLTDFQYCT